MSRHKAKRRFPEGFAAAPEEMRFGTPLEVAEYRAKRLVCDTLLEIGCGVGFQTAAFAKTCKKVIAIDIDAERIQRAKANLTADNVEFYAADALDPAFIKKLPKIDIIFCDPSRPPQEVERTHASLSPRLQDVQSAYACKEIAYEVPPQLQDLPDAEKEYLSLHGSLNRLTLYFGRLKERELSLIDVPSEERLLPTTKKPKKEMLPKFIGEPTPAVVKAGLTSSLAILCKGSLHQEEKKTLIFANTPQPSAFVRWYQRTDSRNGDLVLHFPIPAQEYTAVKQKLRIPPGKATIHVFKIDGKYVYCQRA